MPAPQVSVSFSSMAAALNQQEIERRAREARMQNALEILAYGKHERETSPQVFARFVRATAREGLGREAQT
jgi:uncharacterized protein YqeY